MNRDDCCQPRQPSTTPTFSLPTVQPTENCDEAVLNNDVVAATNCYQAAIEALQARFDVLDERVELIEFATNQVCDTAVAAIDTLLQTCE